ncbi:cupin domain-containing protein [Altericroceibacterium xinjiangense]|uniref:cupin domain-containing protein n=1 Tax=Altericroceibacterium xinjiangense TaxID=762261 RepID=UPI000F7FA828|nr:cupin domain-containing protein [Altericroceibacterium xinjiangense]
MQMCEFDIAEFLRGYWQKKPLLIRNPWKEWSNPLEPDELAGLACEDDVESRLVTQPNAQWELEHGPLPTGRFSQLGREPWTLLVQAVDHHVPAVAALLESFRFIPNWRVEDVMVSYAVDGGGVGPHFDQYDVFLVQGLGKRRWQLGGLCGDDAELLPHGDLRLLANFQPTDEWILEPGDILYVPPRYAHNGIAVGNDCMTYSIGFRAPSRGELIGNWAENLCGELGDDDRYADPDLSAPENPGEISPAALRELQGMIAERVLDSGAFMRWFGRYTTAPKSPETDWRPEEPAGAEDVYLCLSGNVPLIRNPASRVAFVRQTQSSVLLFVDGRCFPCAGDVAAFAERLCAESRFVVSPDCTGSQAMVDLIVELFNQGSLAFDLEEQEG